MNNLDVIARMVLNGWHIIPAEPGEKQTYCKWGMVTPANYYFSGLFKGAPLDTNAAILCDGLVVVVDLDAHGATPNGADLFERLDTLVYQGAIVEKTPSGGVHIYYRVAPGISYHSGYADLDGEPVKVEVLAGRRLSYCWPTVTEKGAYEIISPATFLNTAPGELAPLPAFWLNLAPLTVEQGRQEQETPRKHASTEELSEEDRKIAFNYFTTQARFNGDGRHEQARALARCLAGIGIDEREIERACANYIEGRGRELTDKTEARRIAEYGLKKPLDAKPWRAIMAGRRKRYSDHIAGLLGGAISCPT